VPTYSFTTTDQGLEQTMTELSNLRAEFTGPVTNAHSFAGRTIFLTDPAGNHYAIYTPKTSADQSSRNKPMTGVGYIELEAPDVNASIDFYAKVLGFEVQDKSNAQATLKMASGQTLILTCAPFSSKGLVMSRKVPGPHIAFYVPAAKWKDALAHLETLGIENGDRGAAKERTGEQGGTYMDDPAGYVIQFITDGME
jgi:catechol-2,3-dioxygenase